MQQRRSIVLRRARDDWIRIRHDKEATKIDEIIVKMHRFSGHELAREMSGPL